ncbi:MAG: methylated-DNA--[protein]-cysteine S-methyltransferase [bacterium]|nr:methylated-DNA--[protein]-cysteine S-methyltransferase [bacterium]
MEEILYSIFNTTSGWMGIAANKSGLKATVLPQIDGEKALSLIKEKLHQNNLVRDEEYFKKIKTSLIDYFEGKRVVFDYPLDLRFATEFEKNVWKATQTIPYGEVKTYQFIAKAIGNPKALRAVGQALKKNPLPIIIPCHRVIQSNGKSGGFSGGVKFKEKLLRIEI